MVCPIANLLTGRTYFLESWCFLDPKFFKITYNATLFRVKADFTFGAMVESPAAPAEAMEKATSKIEAVKAAGQIVTYRLYNERFQTIWERARGMGVPKGMENHRFNLSLAGGSPELPGLTVTAPTIDKTVCNISIQAPRPTVQGWRIEWVKIILRRELDRLGLQGFVCPAMLQGALLRAQAGEVLKDYALGPIAAPERPKGSENRLHSLVWNKGRKEVAAVIYEIKPLFDKDQVASLLAAVTGAGQKAVQSAGSPLRVLKTEFLASLDSAKSGPEFFGIDLPLVQLVVTGVGVIQQELVAPPKPVASPSVAPPTVKVQQSGATATVPSGAVPTTAAKPAAAQAPNRGPNAKVLAALPIMITKDKMQAKVGDFPISVYTSFPGLDGEWLRQEIARQSIVFGIKEEFLKAMEDALMAKQPLSGMWVAVGDAGAGGKEGFLQAAVKAEAADGAAVDMRSAQNTKIVKRGQLLATITYKVPAVPGRDVKGDATAPPAGDDFPVTASEGVEAKGLKFYATADGVPVIDPMGSISLSRSMLHEGDVNLTSGNINFDGPVEIKGSVDTGSDVFATGDIIIHGDVRGGRVRALGSITINGSCNTGEAGFLKAGGAIQAQFLQNSTAICGGDLIVKKSILQSRVTVGGGIQCLEADSIISGGHIRAVQFIKVGNLGQPNGNPTDVMVGVDGMIEDRVLRLQKRMEKVHKKNDEDRNNLRELVRKKDAQMTQRHTDLKLSLQERVQRGSALAEKIKVRIEGFTSQKIYNNDGRIYVSGRCVTNCKLTMAGTVLPMLSDIAGVVILAKKWAGSNICSIEDWMAKEARDDTSFKKAG